jgi:NAD(P)-dependent dehydrogenase (short-subunit alcohol dehydrogenase family)
MTGDMTGKVVLVTGASSGIGLSAAEALAAAGRGDLRRRACPGSRGTPEAAEQHGFENLGD